MDHRGEGGVGFGVLSHVGGEVLVLGDEVHDVLLVLLGREEDVIAVLRDVDEVGVDAVAVHVVGIGEAVAAGDVALIEDADERGQLERGLVADGGHQAVRSGVAGILEHHEVRALDRVEAGEHGLGIVAGTTGEFLLLGVGVGEHELEVPDRLQVGGVVEHPAIALVGVGQHVGRDLVVALVGLGRIDVTVVGAGEAGPGSIVLGVPVLDQGVVDRLVEDPFEGHRPGEGRREAQVKGQGRLPDLGHLEVRVDAVDGGLEGAVFRLDVDRVVHRVEFIELGKDVGRVGQELVAVVLRGEGVEVRVAHLDRLVGVVYRGEDGEVLEHGRVGRHVRQVDERETAGEETGAAADLHALVPEDIPGEAHARGDLDVGLRPEARVDVPAAEVEVIDGLVLHDVVVVVEDGVETDAGSQLEPVGDVPLILGIHAELGELDTGGRGLVAAVTIGKGNSLRRFPIQEVIEGAEAVVTGAFTHVSVIGELVLEAGACGQLVGTGIIGDVVLDVEDAVVDTVVPGEEFVTRGDVRIQREGLTLVVGVRLHDVDEGELGGIGTADILDVGVGREELVRQVRAEAAVEVEGDGPDVVLGGIDRVGEGHRVFGQAVQVVQAVALLAEDRVVEVTGVAVGAGPGLVLRIVVAEGQVVVLVDVPVDAAEELEVAERAVVVGVAAGIVTIDVLQVLGNLVHVGLCRTGRGGLGVADAVLGRTPGAVAGLADAAAVFTAQEEEELVLDDRAADGAAIDRAVGVVAGRGLAADGLAAAPVGVLVIRVSRRPEGVGTGLGDGVDTAADEVGLADVVRGNDDLDFLDGVEGNWHAAARERLGKAEVVVEVRTVDGEVGAASVKTAEAHAVAAVRGQLGDGGDVTGSSREREDVLVGDVGGGTGLLLGGELRRRRGHDHDFLEELGGLVDLRVDVVDFTELEGHIGEFHGLVAKAGEFHLVGTAGTHTLDGITSVTVCRSAVQGTGRYMDGNDGRTRNGFSVLVRNLTREGGGRHLGKGDNARKHRNGCEHQAF